MNSIRPVWSPTLGAYMTLLVESSSYEDITLQSPYINTGPFTGSDPNNLPDGIIALNANKVTQFKISPSSAEAALKWDGNVECSDLSQSVNLNRLVVTFAGSFYLVRNPHFIVPTIQFQGRTKDVKTPVVPHDPVLGLYIYHLHLRLYYLIWFEEWRTVVRPLNAIY